MQGKLIEWDLLFQTGFLNKRSCKFGGFSIRQHPTHNVSAEDVDDYVQVKVTPFLRPLELRDIPGPNLVGLCGKQLRCSIDRMSQLIATLLDRTVCAKDTVHSGNRAVILVFIQ